MIKPSFDIILFAAYEHTIVFVIDSVVKLFGTITKTTLRSNAVNSLQICANLQKHWKNAMSNDALSIEIIDQSHVKCL